MKKVVFFVAGMLIVTAVVLGQMFAPGSQMEKLSDLALENVEALSVTETSTSWNCSSTTYAPCGVRCGVCGTSISGTGSLTGMHNCQ